MSHTQTRRLDLRLRVLAHLLPPWDLLAYIHPQTMVVHCTAVCHRVSVRVRKDRPEVHHRQRLPITVARIRIRPAAVTDLHHLAHCRLWLHRVQWITWGIHPTRPRVLYLVRCSTMMRRLPCASLVAIAGESIIIIIIIVIPLRAAASPRVMIVVKAHADRTVRATDGTAGNIERCLRGRRRARRTGTRCRRCRQV